MVYADFDANIIGTDNPSKNTHDYLLEESQTLKNY
jgi:hypothetical protein